MTEIPTGSTAPPPEKKQQDATSWAGSVSRLQVSEVPRAGLDLNVAGRQVVGPLQGFGPLWQKSFRVRLTGTTATPAEVVQVWKERFPEFQPSTTRFYPTMAGVKPGEVLLIDATTPAGPVTTGMMVLYSDDLSFTLMTPQGHPESGWVTFSAYEEEGVPVAQVQTLARANDPIYEIGLRIFGSKFQDGSWIHVLSALADHFGVRSEVQVHKTLVDPKIQWAQAKNIWLNAGVRTFLYTLGAPLRWATQRGRRKS